MKKLQLRNGASVDVKTGSVEYKEEEVPDQPLPQLVAAPRENIKLEDLPSAPKQMNVINAVIGYRLLGCSDADIAYALGCTDDQLFNVVQSEPFVRAYNLCIEAFVAGQTKTAKDVISGASLHAAQTLVDVVKKSKSETNRMRASESILNRLGINEANADHAMSQGLIIKVVKDTQVSDITIKIG